MNPHPKTMAGDTGRFATLAFERAVDAPVDALWQAWTAPAARAAWAAPSPAVTVEWLQADTGIGGREVSICKVEGEPDIRCEAGWLVLQPARRSVGWEVVSSEGETRSAALVTADFSGADGQSRIAVTVQLSALADGMEAGYREGFAAGTANAASAAERIMVLEKRIRAPRALVWGAWMNAETLPQWWGPDGFSCRTRRIDLREGGDWVFDMIGPDGTVYPNHHRYGEVKAGQSLAYTLHWGENGPKHADAWASFEDEGDTTRLTLCMLFATTAEFRQARDMGAIELGHQTLGKLERFVGG